MSQCRSSVGEGQWQTWISDKARDRGQVWDRGRYRSFVGVEQGQTLVSGKESGADILVLAVNNMISRMIIVIIWLVCIPNI